MGLELFSDLNLQIPKKTLDEILLKLQDIYQQVYTSESGSYGFVRYGEKYQVKEPPLFDISILKEKVILSVYGDLNDQRIITEQVSNIFLDENICINLLEE